MVPALDMKAFTLTSAPWVAFHVRQRSRPVTIQLRQCDSREHSAVPPEPGDRSSAVGLDAVNLGSGRPLGANDRLVVTETRASVRFAGHERISASGRMAMVSKRAHTGLRSPKSGRRRTRPRAGQVVVTARSSTSGILADRPSRNCRNPRLRSSGSSPNGPIRCRKRPVRAVCSGGG